MKTLGFTGTSSGMTPVQEASVHSLILQILPDKAVHGGCVGADTQFHRLCILEELFIEVFPSDRKQGDWEGAHVVHSKMHPLKRNPLIVAASDILIVAPKELQEVVRSGTWTTYRRAKYTDCPRWIVFPNGTYREE